MCHSCGENSSTDTLCVQVKADFLRWFWHWARPQRTDGASTYTTALIFIKRSDCSAQKVYLRTPFIRLRGARQADANVIEQLW